MRFDGIEEDPSNAADPKWRHELYVSSHKLAISVKVLPSLLHAATTLLVDLTAHIEALSSNSASLSADILQEIDDISLILTLLNAHHYTGWNIRKHLILRSSGHRLDDASNRTSKLLDHDGVLLKACERELKHISLAQTKRPKPGEAWAHRSWVLRLMERIETCPKEQIAKNEAEKCRLAATGHKRNYYAWSYRLKLAKNWMAPNPSQSIDQGHLSTNLLLSEEFKSVWDWLRRNFNDASAAHHCLVLMRLIGDRNINILFENTYDSNPALKNCEDAILSESLKYLKDYSAGETWWYVRRFVLANTITRSFGSLGKEDDRKECEELILAEVQIVEEMASDADKKLNALRHIAWIVEYYRKHLLSRKLDLPKALESHTKKWREELKSIGWAPCLLDSV